MRKLFTSLLFVVASVCSAWADEGTISIVDAEGNVVKSGSVVTVNTFAKELDQDGNEVVADYFDSGLFVRLNGEDGVAISAAVSVTAIDCGTLAEALAGRRNTSTEPCDYTTGYASHYPGDPRPLNLMWTPDGYGTCEVTVQVNVYERQGIFPPFTYEKVEDGPVVTVRFVNEQPEGTISIVDAEGNVVKSGSVVTVNTFAKELDQDGNEVVADYFDSGLFVRLNGEDGVAISAAVSVTAIDCGTLAEALAGRRNTSTEPCDYTTGYASHYPGDPRPLNLMWTPDGYGTCEVTVQVNVYERQGIFPPFTYEKVEDGPVVTVCFVNANDDTTGMSTTDVARQSVARYMIGGQQLSAPRRGLNIVRYADGTVRKVYVK